MDHREMMLNAIKGKGTDVLPFVPRLDLWYKANKHNGTLPDRYKKASLMEMTRDLGVGYHAVVPDFKDLNSPEDEADRALGISCLRAMPFRYAFASVERTIKYENDLTMVEYRTPAGVIRTKVLYDDEMRKAGITISHTLEHAIKSTGDLEIAAYIFRDIQVIDDSSGYEEFKAGIGENGITVAYAGLAASGMHHIQKELMPVDSFFYEQFDHPDELKVLSDAIEGYFDKVFEAVSKSSAEVVFYGSNYDSSITYPPFFRDHIVPSLKKRAKQLHKNDKLLLTHTDGENKGLLEHYVDSDIDIADSICPYPMTTHTLKDIRKVFGKNITIWGGIPSVSLLQNSMSDIEFERFLNKTLEDAGSGDHLILAIADTTPPAADFSRIKKIIDACNSFGRVMPSV